MAGKPGMAKYRATRGLHLGGQPQAEQIRWWEEQQRCEREWLAEAIANQDTGQAKRARRWLADSERHLARVREQVNQTEGLR